MDDRSLRWTVPGGHPPLVHGEIHVWRGAIPARGGRGVAGATLRRLLGRYLARDGARLEIHAGERGKPALAPRDAGDPPLHFNMSHSAGLALFAFAVGSCVGVDVELLRPRHRDLDALRAWVDREARLKCVGATFLGEPSRALWVAQLDAGAGVAAAVACEHPARTSLWEATGPARDAPASGAAPTRQV